MAEHGISLYKFGVGDTVDKEENNPPFAVVGSNVSTMLSDGRIVRGREYPWGTVNIEDKVGIELANDFLCQIFYQLCQHNFSNVQIDKKVIVTGSL